MKKKIKLDAYERDIEKNFGKGEKLKNEKEVMAMLLQAAKNYVAQKKS
jgi:predicted kinase